MKLPPSISAPRSHQLTAIGKILGQFNAGHSVVMLDGPTGSGKTLIAELTRQLLKARALYLCNTRQLQDQFSADFSDAAVIMGQSNYRISPTVTVADCTKHYVGKVMVCQWCDPVVSCPYEIAKHKSFYSDLVCSNISYFLHEANYVGRLPIKRDLIIVDEADTLEDELMRFVQVRITPQEAREYGIDPPTKKTVVESWVDWAVMAHERVGVLAQQTRGNKSSARAIRRAERLGGLHQNLSRLLDPNIGLASDNWIYSEYDKDVICFKPVTVGNLAHDFLWRHASRWLLMSATMISFHSMIADLGITNGVGISIPSTFPPRQRPIRIEPVVKMSEKTKQTAWPQMAKGLENVLRRHPDERTLVHTVSYPLAAYLTEHLPHDLRRRVHTYRSTGTKAQAIRDYLATPAGVLVAPSLDRGIDLPADDCRVVVVCKIPFKPLGDKQVSKRRYGTPGGATWYAVQAARSLVQMTGRGMRSADDYCLTYILDAQFGALVWKRQHLLPQWWKDALPWGQRKEPHAQR